MNKSTFVYVTFIRTTPERVWSALTTPEFIQQYWVGVRGESAWTTGSPWKLVYPDGTVTDTGEIVEATAPRRLVIRWRNEWKEELKAEGYSLCTFDIETVADSNPPAVKLSVTHEIDRPESKLIVAVSGGWPLVLSNLKSFLETGDPVLKANISSS